MMKLIISILSIGFLLSSCTNKNIKTEVIKNKLGKKFDLQNLKSLCDDNINFGCQLGDLTFKINEDTKLSILQGYTDAFVSQISIVQRSTDNYVYFIIDQSNNVISFDVNTLKQSKSNWMVKQITARGLKTEDKYSLYVVGEHGSILDKRSFRALDLNTKKPKIAVASSLDDKYKITQKNMWKQLVDQKPDMIFLIGDNVFANNDFGKYIKLPKPKTIWRRYVQTRNRLLLYKIDTLIPTIATWDDDDFGEDNGDRTSKYKASAKRIFNSFYAQEISTKNYHKGPGVSSYLSAFGQNFFFMDNRYFRTKNDSKPPYETHWGKEQEKWLFKNLSNNKKPSWLINGGQFFANYHPWESYQRNQPTNFKKIINRLKEFNFPIAFLSGDAHLTELMKIKDLRYTTYEITTSGIHSKLATDSWVRYPNPNKITGSIKHNNYVLLKPYAKNKALFFNVKAFGKNKKIIYNKNLKVQNKIDLFEIKLNNNKKRKL